MKFLEQRWIRFSHFHHLTIKSAAWFPPPFSKKLCNWFKWLPFNFFITGMTWEVHARHRRPSRTRISCPVTSYFQHRVKTLILIIFPILHDAYTGKKLIYFFYSFWVTHYIIMYAFLFLFNFSLNIIPVNFMFFGLKILHALLKPGF